MNDLDHFYEIIDELRDRCGGERRLATSHGRLKLPERGVYFLFEQGEIRPDGQPRVVRVGTHALKAGSNTTLWKRLAQHRGHVGGRRPGGGNHRGSIFRLHVGQCLLARDGDLNSVATTWGIRSSAERSVRSQEHPHEVAVSDYIGAMPYLWVSVPDEPGPYSDRGVIEAGAIALLSRRSNPAADPASDGWLGRWSTRDAVRESGLWNVNHVDGPMVDHFLAVFEHHVQSMRNSGC